MSSRESVPLLLTCEHATNFVPEPYRRWFRGAGPILRSHRGWDPGALELAQAFSAEWQIPCHASRVSRLLVEPNRSIHHRQLFSEFTSSLDPSIRQEILNRYYWSHRQLVEAYAKQLLQHHARIVHIGIHTFTPELQGEVRNADIGILFDPQRKQEQSFARRWKVAILEKLPEKRIRFNYPYRGASDGLTTSLRKILPDDRYLGIELEVNQRFRLQLRKQWPRLCQTLAAVDLPFEEG